MKSNATVNLKLDIVKSFQSVQKGDWVVVGYAMTTDLDSDDMVMGADAIAGAQKDLESYSTVLFNHDPDKPIGKVVDTTVDAMGLLVKIVISKEEPEIWTKVQEGIITKFSFKGRASDFEEVMGQDNRTVLVVHKLELFEVSLVSVPANSDAKAISWYISKSIDTDPEVNLDEDKELLFDFTDESNTRPIYQLNEDGALELSDGSNKFRKQILKVGKWYHWNAEGGVLNITKDILKTIVKNFKDGILDQVSIPLTHSTNPALNTGEVLELIQTEDGLDAICEIKDTTVVDKIKNGLIKSVSASLDPNYLNKTSGKFIGPVLLHTALVQEPFIKGMRGFIQLADEFGGRPILQFENKELTLEENLQVLNSAMSRLFEQLDIQKDGMSDAEKIKYMSCIAEHVRAGDNMAVCVNTCKEALQKSMSEEIKKEEIKKDEVTVTEVKPEEVKPSDATTEENKVEVSPAEDAEVTELLKSKGDADKAKYDRCVAKETKNGASAADAKKTCQAALKKSIEDTQQDDEQVKTETSTEKTETEAKPAETTVKPEEVGKVDEVSKVDLADSTGVYEKYLKAGKIVPAQKDALMKILNSKKSIDLGDGQVDIKQVLVSFLETAPRVINFSEEGTAETKVPDAPATTTDKKGMPAEVKDFYMKKMELSEDAAQKAWEDAQARNDAAKDTSTIF